MPRHRERRRFLVSKTQVERGEVSDSATIVPPPKDMRFSRRNAACGIAAPWECQESAQYCLFHPVRGKVGNRPTATYTAAICYVRFTSILLKISNLSLDHNFEDR
jgi:hypothetical protein